MSGPDPRGGRPDPEVMQAGHETAEVRARPIAIFSIGLVIVVVLVGLFLVWWFRVLADRESRSSPPLSALEAAGRDRLPPAPRLQVEPLRDYQAFRTGEDSLLGNYGWVDPDSGLVRIPIESAMERLAGRGLPARGASRGPEADLRFRDPVIRVEPAPAGHSAGRDSMKAGHSR